MNLYRFLRPLIFGLDPESAHQLTLNILRLSGAIPPVRSLIKGYFAVPDVRPVEFFGLRFPNRIGLAAGYDKDTLALQGLASLGFGHIEVGTVTPQAQPGNERPRIFRLPRERALINRLGFPSRGAAYVAQRLALPRPDGLVIGVNLGKNKDTPMEHAEEDYVTLLHTFAPLADYLTINVSSPNTAGLRQLQMRHELETLLGALVQERQQISQLLQRKVPLLLKLSPDLLMEELEQAVGVVIDLGLDGIIATNTTVSRQGLGPEYQAQQGGLSGVPLEDQSNRALKAIVEYSKGQIPVIAVGGVRDVESACRKLDLGAALIQVYTGLVYQGPSLVAKLVRATNQYEN